MLDCSLPIRVKLMLCKQHQNMTSEKISIIGVQEGKDACKDFTEALDIGLNKKIVNVTLIMCVGVM